LPAPTEWETKIFTARNAPIGKHHSVKVSTPARPTAATDAGPRRLTNKVSINVIVLTDNIDTTIGQAKLTNARKGVASQLNEGAEEEIMRVPIGKTKSKKPRTGSVAASRGWALVL
jgi:hypothetical protein